MNAITSVAALLHPILVHPAGGITGLVDNLLLVCRVHNLQLDWQADRFRVRYSGDEWHELADLTLRKSVFRAILARIAVLCNERTPNSVSPYGGHSELSVGADPPTVFKVAFTNTAAEQKFELTTATEPAAENGISEADMANNSIRNSVS